MVKSKAPLGSLSAMHSTVKKAAATKGSQGRAQKQDTFKSKEFVEDSSSSSSSSSDGSDSDGSNSDSDVDIEAERKKLAAKAASKKTAEVKVNGTKTAPTKPTTTSRSKQDSSNSSSDTSSASIQKKPARADPTNQSTSTSEDESSDSSDEEEQQGQGAKLNTKNQASDKSQPAHNHLSSSSESDSDSPASEDDSDEEETSASRNDGEKDNGDATAAGQSNELSRPRWLNNSDFTIRKASNENPGKEVTEFLSQTNLEGKQVWYFTAPASLPITVLKDMEIDLAKATSGGALLNYKGDDYGLDLEAFSTNTQIQLLIPSKTGEKYSSLNRGIDSTVHLRRMLKFGPNGDVSSTATDQYAAQPRAIREQPQGLKPRFTPLGVPNEPRPTIPLEAQSSSVSSKAHATPKAPRESSSESSDSASDSSSEDDSDVEMTGVASTQPIAPVAPTKKSETPASTNGNLKRKHPETIQQQVKASGPVSKSVKRTKTSAIATPASSQSPMVKATKERKETPISTPSLARVASRSSSTPSGEAKDKSKKSKSPKKAYKQTPIPLPKFPGMKS
ncbi:DNA-directed RNA polymerase I subunit RPA34.5-domain-containing protein [Xylariomycetidae sp. FL2044]|nr:DNA-directed RNA polymerase I subunit RPA34.5-domain-containing protein [Xylariomycetidae sp. FL2044]